MTEAQDPRFWQVYVFMTRTGRVVLGITGPSRDRLQEYVASRLESIQPFMFIQPLRYEQDYTEDERAQYDAWLARCQARAAEMLLEPSQGREITGAEIRRIRKFLGLSQEDLARELDSTATTIARWERSEVNPGQPAMVRLALERLLDVHAPR